jgi:5-methylcytosine-specific restriction protein A
MIAALETEVIRHKLENRFGIRLLSAIEIFDGGQFPVMRPVDIESGVGFCIALARTHRQVEASFRADNFSAGLLKRMSAADNQSRKTFLALCEDASRAGAQIYIAINGIQANGLPVSADPWRMLELTVARRLGVGSQAVGGYTAGALYTATICLSLALTLLPIEETHTDGDPEVVGLPEGARVRVETNRFERSPANRAACIAHYGAICRACGFDFGATYGPRGEGYIEVHHRVPVSQMGADYFVNPIQDLVTLCANCHSILHRTNPPMSVEDLISLLLERRRLIASKTESIATATD